MKHAVFAAALAVVATSANAQTFSGTGNPADDPTFAGGSQQLTFTGSDQSFTSYTENGVTFGPGRISSQYADDYNSTGSYYDNDAGNLDPITFSFAAPASAIAFNWGAADTTWSVTLFSGTSTLGTYSLTPTSISNAKDYFGFTGNNITSVSLTNGGSYDWVFIDNLTYAASAGVPEPATWALMILGFGAVGGAMRRRQSVAAKVRFA